MSSYFCCHFHDFSDCYALVLGYLHIFCWCSNPTCLPSVSSDKQGHQGLKYDAAQALQMHVAEVFSKWISCSAHFTVISLPLVEGWHWAVATSERCQQRSRVEYQDRPMHNLISSESGLHTAVGWECPNYHGVFGPNRENRRWPHA